MCRYTAHGAPHRALAAALPRADSGQFSLAEGSERSQSAVFIMVAACFRQAFIMFNTALRSERVPCGSGFARLSRMEGRARGILARPASLGVRFQSHGGGRSPHHLMGVTGFDRVGLRWAAGRGLLATLNRGTVKMN